MGAQVETGSVLIVKPHPSYPGLLVAFGSSADLLAGALHRPVMLDEAGRLVCGFPRWMTEEVRREFGAFGIEVRVEEDTKP